MRSGFLFPCLLLWYIACLWGHQSWAQSQALIDSLSGLLPQAIGTERVEILIKLCWEYRNSDFEKALLYGEEAIKLSSADELAHFRADALSFVGLAYRNQGNYPKALDHFLQALSIAENQKDSLRYAHSLNNLGDVYNYLGEHDRAINFSERSLQIMSSLNDSSGMAYCYNRLGEAYKAKLNYQEAFRYFSLGLDIRKRQKNKRQTANALFNIGTIYQAQELYQEALNSFTDDLNIREQINDKVGATITLYEMAFANFKLKRLNEALKLAERSLAIARQTGALKPKTDATLLKADIYFALGKSIPAFEELKKGMQLRDSLLNEATARAVANTQHNYEIKQKEAEIELLNRVYELESQRQRQLNYLLSGISLLILSFAFTFYRSSTRRRQINKKLYEQQEEILTQSSNLRLMNEEITRQKILIERKSAGIESSIRYACRIQSSILPPLEEFTALLPDSFILYRPRDIVSGDFYWISSTEDDKIVLAVADCTGHGVPGAFMSMIGHNLLNEIVNTAQVYEPAYILKLLQIKINELLRQEASESRDGMDIAVCTIERKQKRLTYAGAKFPLMYLIADEGHSETQTIKADSQAIGGSYKLRQGDFTAHSLQWSGAAMFYLFTDGYQDQFGGEHDKKLSVRKLRNLLTEIHILPLQEQQERLELYLNQWQGNNAQVDDILAVGFRL